MLILSCGNVLNVGLKNIPAAEFIEPIPFSGHHSIPIEVGITGAQYSYSAAIGFRTIVNVVGRRYYIEKVSDISII